MVKFQRSWRREAFGGLFPNASRQRWKEGEEEEEKQQEEGGGAAFNLNGLTRVITRPGNLGAQTKSWK